jgi:hypothetical protein
MTTIDPGRLTESRYAMLLGEAGVARLVECAGPFFARPRDPEALARLFAIFRVGEHHAVITIGDWLGTTCLLDVQEGFARLVWDEARHTHVWTERMKVSPLVASAPLHYGCLYRYAHARPR